MARVLITGAGGFLGRALCPALARSHTVWGVLRPPGSAALDVRPVVADLSPGWTDGLDGPVDVVVWLAQSRAYRDFPAGARDMFEVNESAFFELLEWSRRSGVRRFIFASTGSVYRSSSLPLAESDPCDVTSMYAATKLNAEHLLCQYSPFFDCVIGRLFALYGPEQTGTLIAETIARVRDDIPVSLVGGIGPTLTPLYVADCARIISSLLEMERTDNPMILNLAGPETVTLVQIVRAVGSLLGKQPAIEEREGTPASLVADITKLRRLLPRLSFRSLADGLEETVVSGGLPR